MKRRNGLKLSCIIVSLAHLDGEEKFEFWGKLFLRIKAIREVDAPDAAVRMYLHAQSFNVVGACKDCRVVAQFLHWKRIVSWSLRSSVIGAHVTRRPASIKGGKW